MLVCRQLRSPPVGKGNDAVLQRSFDSRKGLVRPPERSQQFPSDNDKSKKTAIAAVPEEGTKLEKSVGALGQFDVFKSFFYY